MKEQSSFLRKKSTLHAIETSKAIGKSISDSFQKEVIDGDAYSRSHWFAYATGSLAEIVFGSKGAG
ncbi:hypothetical protein, partial [Bacillus sp. Root920]|uniref:hypothetical protein n=1 Tax=Bacillus sp. Root920 TaxID=1736608 RepID=UPI001F309020